MMAISEKDARKKIVSLLAKWLKVSKKEIRKKNQVHNKNVDGHFKVGKYGFIIEIKSGGNSAQVSSAIQTFKKKTDTISGTPCSIGCSTLHGRSWPQAL